MTATPARIGFVIEPYRRAVTETLAVTARHGNLARETADPLESYFATVLDAQERADQRQDLLSPDRRRFSMAILDVDTALDLLDSEEIVTARLIDPERGIDGRYIITDVVVDTEANVATAKVWG
ncbi:hypothetical protein [Novosphingobium gossypii]|uniref:hypothetical protein n=1 Tax=Novosphingobium gossypii TaxID=1604774 RepID=UPI003D1FC9BC